MSTENTDKNNVEYWYNKGNMLRNLGKHQAALDAFNKAIALDPKKASALYNKGDALYNLNRVEEYLTCYEDTLRINPN